jgi:phosphomevalonate kinase
MVAASAPGKLVLCGEYAVLDGASALVMAVDRRAVARRVPADTGSGAAPGGLLDAVRRVSGIADRELAVEMDTAAFHRQGEHGARTKLGLGASAALAAALCRLLLPSNATERAVLESALAAHRQFQSGSGSGVDVAASVVGGLLCYRMHNAEVERHRWPPGLSWSAWWSGVPAGTTARLAAWSCAGASAERRALAGAADETAAAWRTADAGTLLAAFEQYTTALAAFDRRHELGIFGAGHADLVAAGTACGVVYKPCGAGGGDVGIAMAADSDALDRFDAAAAAQGFTRLSVAIDPRGAALESAGT